MTRFILFLLLSLFSTILLSQNIAVCGFSNKKVITIQGNQITGGPHTDFPILINHADAINLTTAAGKVTSASGFDIIFADDNGNLLDFQLESYNGTTGQIVAWVKIPTLTNGTDVDIHMLYGKTTVVTDQSTTDTWNSDFSAVWHMSEDPSGTAPQIIDHTSSTNNGTSNGSMTSSDLVPGFIGNGIDFDGSNDYINIGDRLIDGRSSITVEAWINPTSLRTTTNPTGHNGPEAGIVHKANSGDDNIGITVSTGGTAFYLDDGANNTVLGTAPPTSSWTYLVATWNGSVMTLYQDGVFDGTLGNVDNALINNNNSLRIGGGHVTGATFEFNGIIDEVRISSVARSGNWIATSRSSQNNPEGTFYTISTEIDNAFISAQNADWDLTSSWSGSGIPHVGANVIVNHRVDIDGGSDEYIICNCTISNSTGINADIVINSGRVLTIIEDFTLENVSTTEIDLNLDDNGTTINVLGDMIVTNSSNDVTRDIEIDLDNATFLNVTGELTLSAVSGDNVELDISGTSSVTIGGDLLIDQDGGNDIQILVDTDASIDVTGNVTIDRDGGDDLFIEINDNVNGTAEFRIGGNLDIDHNGGDDIVIIVDDANSLLEVAGDFLVDWDSGNDDDLTINLDGGNFTVLGTSSLSRRNNAHEILFDMDGGNFTTGSLTLNNSGTNAGDHSFFLRVDETSVLTVNGDLTINQTGGDDVNIFINNDEGSAGVVDINGDVLIDHDGGDDVQIFVNSDGEIDISGDFVIDQDGGDNINIELNIIVNGSAAFRVDGGLTVDHDGGDDVIFLADDPGSLFQVGGNLDLDWDSTDDDDITFNLDGGDFTIAGTTTMSRRNDAHEIIFDMDGGNFTTQDLIFNNFGSNNADHSFFIDIDEASKFTVNGDFQVNQSGGNIVRVQVNNNVGTDGELDINGNLNIDHDGGGELIFFSSGTNSIIDVSGALFVDHDGGGRVELSTRGANAVFNIGTTATVEWDGIDNSQFEVDLNSGTMNVSGLFSGARGGDSGELFFDLDGGDFNANSGMSFTSSGTLGTDGSIVFDIDNNSTFTCAGNLTTVMNGADDFRINVNNNTGTVGQFNCTGNLEITRSSGDDIEFFVSEDNSLINVGGDLTITTTGGEEVLFEIQNDATINVDGNMSITATEGQVGSILLGNTGVPSLDIGGNFDLTIAGGDDNYLIDLDAGEMTVGQDMTLTESTGNNQLFLDIDGANLSVTRDFFGNIRGIGTVAELLINLDDGAIMTVGRDLELDLSGGNDLEFHLEQNVTAGTAQLNVTRNLTLDHNGATGGDDLQLIINDDSEITVGNDFTMDTDGSGSAGNFYTHLNDNSLLDVDGDIVMNSVGSGLLQMVLINDSKLELAGNFVRQTAPNNFGILSASGATVIEYNGTTNAQIFAEDAGAGTDAFHYDNVIINNSFGAFPQLTMEGLATVHGDITFTDGIIASTSTNLLVLSDNSNALSESDISHVDGPVKKIGNDAFNFPVGDSLQLQQISITAPSNFSDEFTAQYFEVNPRPIFNGASLDPTIDHISGCEYWVLDRNVGSSDVQVTLNYDINSCEITDLTSLIVARWDGTTWKDHMGTVAGTLASGTVQTPAVVSNFSPFTLASTNSANPLPIELLRFEAVLNDNEEVDLFWSTASEINNAFFTVQQSVNGFDWTDVLIVNGAGNSSSILNYSEKDAAPHIGLSYYRLAQTDFDGTTTYFNIVPINLLVDRGVDMLVYPNPVAEGGVVYLEIPSLIGSEIEIAIRDIAGRNVLIKDVLLDKETRLIQLNLTEEVSPGTYVITVKSRNTLYRKKLMVK